MHQYPLRPFWNHFRIIGIAVKFVRPSDQKGVKIDCFWNTSSPTCVTLNTFQNIFDSLWVPFNHSWRFHFSLQESVFTLHFLSSLYSVWNYRINLTLFNSPYCLVQTCTHWPLLTSNDMRDFITILDSSWLSFGVI